MACRRFRPKSCSIPDRSMTGVLRSESCSKISGTRSNHWGLAGIGVIQSKIWMPLMLPHSCAVSQGKGSAGMW